MFTGLKYLLIRAVVGVITMAILFMLISQNPHTKFFVQTMAPQAIIARVNAPIASSARLIDSPLPTPTATQEPTSSPYPPIAWNPLPPCKNEPWDATRWLHYLTENSTEPASKQALSTLFLRQIHPMSAALQATDMDGLLDLLATKDNDSDKVKVLRRDVASVWLNVIGGHLQRITELTLVDVPEAKTVGDLLNQVESAIAKNSSPKNLLAGLSQFLSGKGITKSVCAQMITSRLGNKIEQELWTEDGITLSEVWKRPSQFPWITYRLSPSPDYRNIAIESFGNETGGPIFLLDLASGSLRNLIGELGHTIKAEIPKEGVSYDQSYPWEVIGWHPDGRHLLIGTTDSGGAIWINLQSNTYRSIVPAIGHNLSGGEGGMDLAANGAGFVYVNWGLDKDEEQQLNFYDLGSNQITTIFTLPQAEGYLFYPRISPTGDSIAYLMESGHPTTGMTYSIRLFDRQRQTHTVLAEGDLSRTEPVWSPDGQKLAFAWKDSSLHPGRLTFAEEEDWRGNIWVVTLRTGALKQVTFINGAARRPVWALDSHSLAFSTHDGQIGITPLEKPKIVWQVAQPINWLFFSSTIYVP